MKNYKKERKRERKVRKIGKGGGYNEKKVYVFLYMGK